MVEFLLFCFRKAYMLFVIKFNCPDRGETIISYCYIRDDLFRTQILHKSLGNIFYMIQSTSFSPVFWNSLRLKRVPNFQGSGGKPILQDIWITWIEGARFLGRNQFWRTAELFRSPFCISILKVLRTQSLCLSLDFNVFSMVQKYFSHSLQVSVS